MGGVAALEFFGGKKKSPGTGGKKKNSDSGIVCPELKKKNNVFLVTEKRDTREGKATPHSMGVIDSRPGKNRNRNHV